MKTHDYTWKCGIEIAARTKMSTNRPLTKDTVIVDLYDGRRYVVRAIHPAKPGDREWLFLPDTVVHTWPLGCLPEDELVRLRARARYTQDEFSGPLADVVFFPAAT
jgi:hypothetical protein